MNYEPHIDKLVAISSKFSSPQDIKTILEIGARDGVETKALHHFFQNARIYSFECNPATVPLWKSNTLGIGQIETIEKAVSDKNGTISFFPIDPEKTKSDWKDGNPGASSLLQASGNYPIEQYAQKEITVQTVTLASFFKEKNIEHVDIVWMDIQGAELMALKGLEDRIRDIGIIHTEVEFMEIYKGQPLATDIISFMNSQGFLLGYFTNFGPYAGDAVFINRNMLSNRPLLKVWLSLKNKVLFPLHSFMRSVKENIKRAIRPKLHA